MSPSTWAIYAAIPNTDLLQVMWPEADEDLMPNQKIVETAYGKIPVIVDRRMASNLVGQIKDYAKKMGRRTELAVVVLNGFCADPSDPATNDNADWKWIERQVS